MSGLDEAKKRSLEAELTTLELMLEEYKLERTAIQNNLQFKGDQLRKLQSKVNAILEDAWVDAQLLDPQTEAEEAEEVQDYDLQTEYRKFQQKMRSAEQESPLADEDAAEELDTSEDYLHATAVHITEAEERNQAVWDAWDRVQAAQEQFDDRDEARERVEQARREALERGDEVEDATSEAFDLRWHVHERKLTRELIEAEEAYYEAQAAVKELGEGDLRAYKGGKSAGEEDYSSSLDHSDIIATAPTVRVERWLADLPSPLDAANPDSPKSLLEVDDWEAAELEVGDSISAIIDAEVAAKRNPMREKIERWKEVQRNLRRDFEASS